MTPEKALKGALIGAIWGPETLVERFVDVAARAAVGLPEASVKRIMAEIDAMTEAEVGEFMGGLADA